MMSYLYSLTTTDGMEVADGSTNANDVMFQDLSPFTNYIFTIVAVTEAGQGPESVVVITTNEPGISCKIIIIKYYY